jgi:hypothetical protein
MLFTAPGTGGFYKKTYSTLVYNKKIRERRKLSLFGERGKTTRQKLRSEKTQFFAQRNLA